MMLNDSRQGTCAADNAINGDWKLARLATPRSGTQYEERLILFIDFLGFKEIVGRTASDPAALTRLIDALNDIGRMGEHNAFASQRVTQFSDSVVLSYAANEESGTFWMINEIALSVMMLAQRGYLLRGALTVGLLYHEDRHVVGPAMVRAVEMESSVACFPRVIVDPAVITLARRHRRERHSPKDEEGYVRSLISEDNDGQLFIDYVSWDAVVQHAGIEDEYYPDYIAQLGALIESGLQHDDVRVAEKYLWLHPRYVEQLDRFKALPHDHGYRRESWDNCEAIERLPSHKMLAKEARMRVKAAKAEAKKTVAKPRGRGKK